MLLGYFGEEFTVEGFTRDHQRAFERARMAGGIVTSSSNVTRSTRARSVESDVVLLHAMLLWATAVRTPGGGFLLDRNPLNHVRQIREKNKKQSAATWERYEATAEAMPQLRAEAEQNEDDDARVRWIRLELALFLAERSGRRLGSIRQLRWEDCRYDRGGVIYWRAEADKKGYQWEVPMQPDFFETVKGFQRTLGAVGGFVFSAPDARDGLMDRHFVRQVAERRREAREATKARRQSLARLPPEVGDRTNALAASRRGSGGRLKDMNTLLEVYQQADEASVLAVTSETRKLRERGVA